MVKKWTYLLKSQLNAFALHCEMIPKLQYSFSKFLQGHKKLARLRKDL